MIYAILLAIFFVWMIYRGWKLSVEKKQNREQTEILKQLLASNTNMMEKIERNNQLLTEMHEEKHNG